MNNARAKRFRDVVIPEGGVTLGGAMKEISAWLRVNTDRSCYLELQDGDCQLTLWVGDEDVLEYERHQGTDRVLCGAVGSEIDWGEVDSVEQLCRLLRWMSGSDWLHQDYDLPDDS